MSGRIMIAITAFVALCTGAASAQPSPSYDADRAAAEQLFIEGRRLMQRAEYAAACRMFKASFDLDPATGTQLNLGDCYVKIGRLASAWGHYRDAAVRAERAGQRDRVRYARKQAAALEPRLPRLRIDMDGAAEVPGLIIQRDGQNMPLEMLGAAVYVDPGEHEITAQAPGFSVHKVKVEITEGEVGTVAIPTLAVASTTGQDAQSARDQGQGSSTTLRASSSGEEELGGSVTAKRGLGFSVSAGLGPKTASGDLLRGEDESYVTGTALLLAVDVPFHRRVGLRAGIGYVHTGVTYSYDSNTSGEHVTIDASFHYVQLPITVRLETPFVTDRFTIRPRIEGGLGANLLVSKGADTVRDGDPGPIWRGWFNGHQERNLSLLFGVGVDVGLGRNPEFLVGVDVVRDAHLLPEWDEGRWMNQSLRYQAWYIGGHVTFQLYRRGDEDTAEEQATARQSPHRRAALSRLQNAWRTD